MGWLMSCVIAALLATADGPGDGVADRIRFRDGQVLLGQVVEPAPAGRLRVVARRDWVAGHLPERSRSWEKAAADASRLAGAMRRQRLQAWRSERPCGEADAVGAWIDAELDRSKGNGDPAAAGRPLFTLDLDRRQVQGVERRAPEAAAMLRQAWRAGLESPEEQAAEALRPLLEGRGFALSGIDPAPVDDLLMPASETEAAWFLRRAATELQHDAGLRFVRAMGTVLPEDGAAAGPGALAATATSVLGELLRDPSAPRTDPLVARLDEVARRGRCGVLVTELVVSQDLATVRVDTVVWVRPGGRGWVPALRRPAVVATDQVQPAEGAGLAGDPQVQTAFRVIEGLGLGPVTPEIKGRSLQVGAATRQALGIAQSAMQRELERWALPVGR